MGTRSLTILNDDDGKEIAVLYRQFDGYPEGHGAELKEFLSAFEIVNGFNSTEGKIANGGSCLTAQLIAHFKGEFVGQFYLHPAGTRDYGEEYIYTVSPKVGEGVFLKVKECYNPPRVLFDGKVEDFPAIA